MPDANYDLDFPARTRVALVGAGPAAAAHLAALAATPDVELVGVCDPEGGRLAAERAEAPLAAAQIESLLRVGVQVAHVAVSPARRAEVARTLLERGVGVYVHTPVALSSAEATALGALADSRRLPFGAHHDPSSHPAFARLLARVAEGRIGRVEHTRVTWRMPLRPLLRGDLGDWSLGAPDRLAFDPGARAFAFAAELVGATRHATVSLLSSREVAPDRTVHLRWHVSAQGRHGGAEVLFDVGPGQPRLAVEVLGSDGRLCADLLRDVLEEERPTPWHPALDAFASGARRSGQIAWSALAALREDAGGALAGRPRADAGLRASHVAVRAYHRAIRLGEPPPHGAAAAAAALSWSEEAAREARGHPQARQAPAFGGRTRRGEVLVVGATGFLGSRTVAALGALGRSVTAGVRRAEGLPAEIVAPANGRRVRLVHADLSDPSSLAEAVKGARAVVHLATGLEPTWAQTRANMVEGTVALAEAAAYEGVERFVFVSSLLAIDAGVLANDALLSDEEAPLDPEPERRAPFARGKVMAERELARLREERGLPVVVARPGVVLGAGTRPQHAGLGRWIGQSHCVGWSSGRHALPLVWVDDVGEALAHLVDHDGFELSGKVFHLVARGDLGARDLVTWMAAASGRALRYHGRSALFNHALGLARHGVARLAGRDVQTPSFPAQRARALRARFACGNARDLLGWRPIEERDAFLRAAVGPMVGVNGADG